MAKVVRMQFFRPAYYRIYVQGDIDPGWLSPYIDMCVEKVAWLGMAPVTLLKGELVDQTALSGVLNLINDLGLPLLGLECYPYFDE